ncbi:MAG: hypothetical protein IKN66_14255 [Ruminococcus sp.]|nr:hypothetical protein [Ruminococcus sp.]
MMNRKKEISETKKIKGLKKLKLKFSKLSTGKKAQVIAASFLTLALLIALPVYAWFALGGKMEAFTKIKEPDNLDIRAGHYDPAQYFSLNDIDIEEVAKGNKHRVVFSVSAGDYKIPYQLQLAHTTNIPFKYEIYRAKEFVEGSEDAPTNPDVRYVSTYTRDQGETNYTFLYMKGTKIELTPMNLDATSSGTYGRQLALGSGSGDYYYGETYEAGDTPEVYAVPIYEQSDKIPYDSNSDHDYFILEISWDEDAVTTGNFSEWNVHENKKETDMIYLTASRYSN